MKTAAAYWRIFFQSMLPMSTPILIVAVILQVTNIWNDFILGLVFAGRENQPMTVQLNDVINSTTGERLYKRQYGRHHPHVTGATSHLSHSAGGSLRGIAAGAVKG